MPWTWLPPHNRYSEFKIIDLWRPGRTAKFLANTWIPSIPRTPPSFGPPFLNDLFWQPTVILQRPDHNGSYTTFPDEAWFFVNGIMTNDSVAQINSAYLAHLFHRPLTMIQNSTDSLWADLFECALGKEWYRVVEPAIKAFPPIYDALKSPHKAAGRGHLPLPGDDHHVHRAATAGRTGPGGDAPSTSGRGAALAARGARVVRGGAALMRRRSSSTPTRTRSTWMTSST